MRKLHKMTHTDIKSKVLAYRLFEAVKSRMNVVVSGGVADVTIRKAFREGPTTPLLTMILDHARMLVEHHEKTISEILQEQETTA